MGFELILFLKLAAILSLLFLLRRDRYAGKCKLHLCDLKAFIGPDCGGYTYCPICHGEEKEITNARTKEKT
jgi:hypothetical protein